MYDLIIIGAGPAGISAAVYAKSRSIQLLLLEKNKVGGIVGKVSTVTHYAAVTKNETGSTFAERLEKQALSAGVDIVYEDVTDIKLNDNPKKVVTKEHTYEASSVILANGSTPKKLGIPGEDKLAGHGIGLNAAKDGGSYQGKNIYVIGGADGAIKEAIYLSQFANKLTIIHFEEKLSAISEFTTKLEQLSNVEVKLNTRLTAVMGTEYVKQLELTDVNTGEKEIIEDDGCGIFIYAGTIPNTQMYQELHLEDNYIVVNNKMETSIPGVYAAGDICAKQVRQVATAVSDGAIAAINVYNYINK